MLDDVIALGDVLAELHDRFAGRPAMEIGRDTRDDPEIDIKIEEAFIDAARARLGDVRIVAEEAVARGLAPTGAGPDTLILDPLDGTTLLRAGDAGYTSTFAIVRAGRLAAGFVYAPTAGGRFVAMRGRGLYRNGAPFPPPDAPCAPTFALRKRDMACGADLAAAVRRQGYEAEHLGSTARRFIEVATGAIGGVAKTIGRSHGVPRVWGMAGGLVACDACGLDIWLDAAQRIVVVGEPKAIEAANAVRGLNLRRTSLDVAWRRLAAPEV